MKLPWSEAEKLQAVEESERHAVAVAVVVGVVSIKWQVGASSE